MTGFLQSISVRAKLALIVGIAGLGLLLVAGVGLLGARFVGDRIEVIVDRDFAAEHALGELRGQVGNLRRYEKDMFLNMGDEKALDRYHEAWRKQADAAQKELAGMDGLLGDEHREIVARMAEGLGNYRRGVEAVVADIRAGKLHDPWSANQAMEAHKTAVRSADKALGEIAEYVARDVAVQREALRATSERTRAWTVGATLLVLAATVGMAWMIALQITSPLARAAKAIERVASGDLTGRIEPGGRDEIGRLLSAIAAMQERLATMLGGLRVGVETVATASSQIAQGSADLSSRTERQAASVQQSASSMEQLTGTVHQTVENARQAHQLAGEASGVAERGGAVVAEVIQTMDQIQQASRRIADITGVIDGIAFQTNILALNAAVEAARAGEQGRGFAVVAGEVRALAQRSAEAAHQIKSLIGDSVERVEGGSALVRSAGQTMDEIVAQVQAVRERIDMITRAADEQASGIEQIGQSVGTLDGMTQQNAALVEQSAAAADSLRQQAERLAQAVSAFRVGSAAG